MSTLEKGAELDSLGHLNNANGKAIQPSTKLAKKSVYPWRIMRITQPGLNIKTPSTPSKSRKCHNARRTRR